MPEFPHYTTRRVVATAGFMAVLTSWINSPGHLQTFLLGIQTAVLCFAFFLSMTPQEHPITPPLEQIDD